MGGADNMDERQVLSVHGFGTKGTDPILMLLLLSLERETQLNL